MINPEVSGQPQIRYRPIKPSDVETLERLDDQLFPTRMDPSYYEYVVANGPRIVSWGAVDSSRPDGQSDELIGYVTAEVVLVGESEIADMFGHGSAESDDKLVYVMSLGVVYKYRNLGIASTLLREVIKCASSISTCRAVYLHAVAINKPAVNLYKKMSFRCVRRLPAYYPIHGEHFDAFLFVYYLDPLPSCSPFYSELEEDPRSLAEGLWQRATAAGAFTRMEKRAFGMADDIYEAGLLFAYMAFVPLCEAGVMDDLSLQRLLENTFQLDHEAT